MFAALLAKPGRLNVPALQSGSKTAMSCLLAAPNAFSMFGTNVLPAVNRALGYARRVPRSTSTTASFMPR